MYFETASFALSSVVCAISRIFSACSLIFSLIALSYVRAMDRWSGSRYRFIDLFQFFTKLIDQNAGVFAVIDRNGDEVNPAVLERPLKRWDEIVGAFDLRAFRPVTLGVFDEIRVSEGQTEIGEMI